MGVFRDAGRVLYRLSSCTPCAGRVLYRGVCAAWLVSGGLREKVLPARVVCVPTVTIFSLLASKGPKWAFFAMLGEFCAGCGHAYRVLGEFCTVGVRCAAGEWWFAGKSSPCLGCLRPDRDNFLPARVKRAEMGVFRDAGRVLYRLSSCTPCAGRVLYRLSSCTPCAGRVLYRLRPCTPCAGRVLYR